MFVQTKTTIGETSGVQFIEGIVTFSSVRLNVYCFFLDGVLIDTGGATLLKEFQSFFNKIDIDQVVLTHHHEDHTGGAAYLQDKYNVPVYMAKTLLDSCSKKAAYPFYRKFFWGVRQPFHAKPIGENFTSRQGNWQVISTPGHAIDHLAFLNNQTGQLFSGDLYVHPKTKVILREESIPTILTSIEKVLTYSFDDMFCCHAGYVKDGKRALMIKRDYLQDLIGTVLEYRQKGMKIKEIQQSLFKKKYPITYFSFGEWNTGHIIRSIIRDAPESGF